MSRSPAVDERWRRNEMDHATSRDLTEALSAGVSELTKSGEWERYLAYQAAFHRYSFGNVVLIASQCPHASQVAGFGTWRALGRTVRRGQHAIWILAPLRRRSADDQIDDLRHGRSRSSGTVGFRPVAVFDISQTQGVAPPAVVHRLTGSGGSDVFPVLCSIAGAFGYAVEDATLDGISNGECDFDRRVIRVEVANSPLQRTKTLVHEIAHARLHEHEEDRALAELEAESVAFVVCRAIGLDTAAYSFGYVASWAGSGDAAIATIKASGARISRTASALIDLLFEEGTVGCGGERSSTPPSSGLDSLQRSA
jgi:hypothetical protein